VDAAAGAGPPEPIKGAVENNGVSRQGGDTRPPADRDSTTCTCTLALPILLSRRSSFQARELHADADRPARMPGSSVQISEEQARARLPDHEGQSYNTKL